jgi:hypothetical protein
MTLRGTVRPCLFLCCFVASWLEMGSLLYHKLLAIAVCHAHWGPKQWSHPIFVTSKTESQNNSFLLTVIGVIQSWSGTDDYSYNRWCIWEEFARFWKGRLEESLLCCQQSPRAVPDRAQKNADRCVDEKVHADESSHENEWALLGTG